MNNMKVSVVIPIYNVEEYLTECIESVINQTIGFEENIEIILVNDGSPDNSEEICLKYQERYPDNIQYIVQENAGVSAARNNGLQYAKGDYVNFLDADDKWDADAFEKGVKLLEHISCIDLVCFRLKFFDAKDDYHMLDYKYTCDGVIDIFERPQDILLHGSCILFRRQCLTQNPFDTRVKISEDTKLVYEVIFNKGKYGIISSSDYNYRKRKDESSAIQKSQSKKYWYFDSIEHVHKYLINLSIEKYGNVIQYVQYFIMYDLQWRIKNGISIEVSEIEERKYVDSIKYLISQIDDEVILAQRNIGFNNKLLAFYLKYGESLDKCLAFGKGMMINGHPFNNASSIPNTIYEFEVVDHNKLLIIGEVNYYKEFKLYYSYNGIEKEIKTYDKNKFGNEPFTLLKKGYTEYIDLNGSGHISFYIEYNGIRIKLNTKSIQYSRLASTLNGSYYFEDGCLFTMDSANMQITLRKGAGVGSVVLKELKYLKELLVRNKHKVVVIRALYWITKPFIRKKVMLFCDREFMARDSAEVLFRYFNSHNDDRRIKTCFVVGGKYEDYKRMKQFGNVIKYNSLKHKLLILHSDFIISSHADRYENNAFGKAIKYYVDLFRFKYVYLTHGILFHDSSHWLNRVNKNFVRNVVSSPLEYKSIVSGNYFFEDNQLIKTGLPRYDNYLNSDIDIENKILFMPTWRSTLAGESISETQRREYNPEFKKSEYFLYYEKLLNDERLLNKLKENSLRIKFCIHPSFRAQFDDFEGNEFVEFAIDVDSQYETLTSKCLVTDYSSAACDFAYLTKPVIYANFDLDHIYDVHYYNKCYFDYDENGFGPNCRTLDETVDELIKLIDSGFRVEEKYEKRMREFFYYKDASNSERVYNELKKMI